MKIYLIPGLGYTNKIFEKLNLSGFDIKFMNWIEPKKNESFNNYAKRLYNKEISKNEPVVLIGHSLGGMIAQEIATIAKIDKIILISSAKRRNEIPFFFRMVKPLRIHKLFTKEMSIRTIKYWGKSHGFTNKSEISLFKDMVGSQTNNYLQWALKSLSKWKEPTLPKTTELFQIHGTNDKTLPINWKQKPDKIIKNGSHIMVYKRPKLISEIIIEELKTAYNNV